MATAPNKVGTPSAGDAKSSSVSVSIPSGTTTGDLLILSVDGWTAGDAATVTPGTWDVKQQSGAATVLTHVYASSDGSSYTVSTDGSAIGVVLYAAHHDDGTPVLDAFDATAETSAGKSHTTPSVTPSTDDCLIVTAYAESASANLQHGTAWTAGSPFTNQGVSYDTTFGFTGVFTAMDDYTQSTAASVSGSGTSAASLEMLCAIFVLAPPVTIKSYEQTVTATASGYSDLIRLAGITYSTSANSTPSLSKFLSLNMLLSLISDGVGSIGTALTTLLSLLVATEVSSPSLLRGIGATYSSSSDSTPLYSRVLDISRLLSLDTDSTEDLSIHNAFLVLVSYVSDHLASLSSIKSLLMTMMGATSSSVSLMRQVGASLLGTASSTVSLARLASLTLLLSLTTSITASALATKAKLLSLLTDTDSDSMLLRGVAKSYSTVSTGTASMLAGLALLLQLSVVQGQETALYRHVAKTFSITEDSGVIVSAIAATSLVLSLVSSGAVTLAKTPAKLLVVASDSVAALLSGLSLSVSLAIASLSESSLVRAVSLVLHRDTDSSVSASAMKVFILLFSLVTSGTVSIAKGMAATLSLVTGEAASIVGAAITKVLSLAASVSSTLSLSRGLSYTLTLATSWTGTMTQKLRRVEQRVYGWLRQVIEITGYIRIRR